MIESIKLFLTSFVIIANALKDLVAVRKAEAALAWSQHLQAGLEPLQQGQPTTDEQKAAAVKAVAEAWAKMPS